MSGLVFASAAMNLFLQVLFNQIGEVTNYYASVTNMEFLAYWMLVCLLNPCLEELFFMGLIFNGFTSRYTILKSKLLTSLLFALSHINIYQFFGSFLLRIFLSELYIKTKSLEACIAGHILYNILVMIIILIFANLTGIKANLLLMIAILLLSPVSIFLIIKGLFLFDSKCVSKKQK